MKKRKTVSFLTAFVVVLTMSVPTFAQSVNVIEGDLERMPSIVQEAETEEDTGIMPASATILQQNGILEYGQRKVFTFNIPKSTTYTLTLVVNGISGDNQVWTTLQKVGGTDKKVDRNITGSFQNRYSLSAGTWELILGSYSGRNIYSTTIHETF